MIYDGFKIAATPFITDAYCKYGHRLIEVPNGLLSSALFCAKCEDVYQLKLVKTPKTKVAPEFLDQCRNKVKKKNE